MAASGEIERDLIPVTRLDDDDIDELHAANRFASRSAYFGQHVAEQRAATQAKGLVSATLPTTIMCSGASPSVSGLPGS